jgi:hypothetical protein
MKEVMSFYKEIRVLCVKNMEVMSFLPQVVIKQRNKCFYNWIGLVKKFNEE